MGAVEAAGEVPAGAAAEVREGEEVVDAVGARSTGRWGVMAGSLVTAVSWWLDGDEG